MFHQKLVVIGDSLSYIACSDDGDDGEDDDDEETGHGQLTEDDELGWVMGTIRNTVQQHMASFWQKKMKLDEMTLLRWEDAADIFRARAKKYGATQ